ncbi:MAG: hypothetical protein AAF790_02880 [Planctomycetota bacterium]
MRLWANLIGLLAGAVLLAGPHVQGEGLRRLPPPAEPGTAVTEAEVATPPAGEPPPLAPTAAPAVRLAAYTPGPAEPGAFSFAPCGDAPFCVPAPAYEVGAEFNRGLFIRSTDLQARPFALYAGGRVQLRYVGFTRVVEAWTDNAGVTRTVRNRNQFDVERARLNLSGTAVSPNLRYLFIFDADGDGGSLVDGLAFHFTYEVNRALRLRLGRWKAAAHREWLLSSRYSRMVDRSLATEFFRVGFTDGLWLLGDFNALGVDGWHYEASLTNGLRTSSRDSVNLDDNLGAAVTLRCDPLGPYGPGVVDYAGNTSPVVRLGASFAYDKSDDRSDAGVAFGLGDDGFLRLSDGTRLADPGALAPGLTLLGDRVLLAAVDAGIKYRGWSASCEVFWRSIQDLTADGPLPIGKINDTGYHIEVGRFLIAKRLDVNARVSQVTGPQGDSLAYAAGFNVYWGDGRDDRVNKFAFDVTRVQRSAINSTQADIFAGDDGVLFRAQTQIGF